MFDCKYLSDEQLKGFEKYKYTSMDTSPISNYVMHPFWNQVVKLFPMWIAPNVLTFVGFLFTVLNAFLLSYFDYTFCASSDEYPECPAIPLWVWLACAVSHFLAHTLDGIDGKQARRTKSSGPLGELFDHGLDSWTSLLIPFCIYSLFGRGSNSNSPLRVLFIFWAIFATFYFSHWEKYNTGILYLPWSYDVSQIILLIMYLVTFKKTHTIWKFTLPFNVTSGQLFEFISHLGSFGISIPVTFYNVYNAYKSKTLKQPNLQEALRPLISLLALFAVTTYWATYSPASILDEDPRMFYFMVGTVFSNIACRLIVSQMSSTRCESFNWFLFPLAIVVAAIFNVNVCQRHEMLLLRLVTILLTLCHIHYGVCLVRQMCSHFNINCFNLRKPTQKSEKNHVKK